MRDDLHRVEFQGGPLSGAVLALPPRVAARVADLDLSVTAGGRVFDRGAGQMVYGAEVIEMPIARRPKPPTRRRISRKPGAS